MDLNNILKVCHSKLLKNHFKGILFCNIRKNNTIESTLGDFYIVNTDGKYGGEHWFVIIRGFDMWILYDCSMLTPTYLYNSIISTLDAPCIIDRKNIEGVNSLLCGEFAITAAIQMTKIIIENGNTLNLKNYPKNFYSDILLKYVDSIKLSPDQFVYNYVYHKLKKIINILPERKKDVMRWLNNGLTE
jgi:hypothetical protein